MLNQKANFVSLKVKQSEKIFSFAVFKTNRLIDVFQKLQIE